MKITKPDHLKNLSPVTTPRTTMAAAVQDRYSPAPEGLFRLARIDRPTIGANEVLVRVHAASVDRGTWHIMAGLPHPIRLAGFGLRRPKYANPGRSLAGTVEAVGTGVSGLAPGDEVYGTATSTFAEYAATRADKLALKPANLTFDQAAAVPVSGGTALQALRDHGRVEAGENVLILGASGGVGSFAVQIAKAFGTEVIGVCSTGRSTWSAPWAPTTSSPPSGVPAGQSLVRQRSCLSRASTTGRLWWRPRPAPSHVLQSARHLRGG